MSTPPPKRRIVPNQDAPVITENDRIALANYLASIKHDDELFMRCVGKCVRALRRYEESDKIWLSKWLPIIERTLYGR